jgi:PHD finger-like domain-containing protein 5A
MASKHQADLVMCRKQPGIAVGRVCERCDGRCVLCDSFVKQATLVRVCDECNYGSFAGKCVVCGGNGVADAYYCKECTSLEKDREGCPKIVNVSTSRIDLHYDRKRYGQR